MPQELDITPLRSLIAVADTGGFHRAAGALQLSQSAVSQHIRRLEKALGRPLVEPDGRRARLTPAGVALLADARRIIAVHDEAVRRLAVPDEREFVIGITEHAADDILPPIAAQLTAALPDLVVRYRFDRTAALNEAVNRGAIDVAIFITEASTEPGRPVGTLPLVWTAAPDWARPADGAAWPLIAIEEPCAIRRRALTVLAEHGIRAEVIGEAAYLAGVVNAVRARLGIALLALVGPPPDGLVELTGVPAAPPVGLAARAGHGADAQAVHVTLRALHDLLSGQSPTQLVKSA
jgi:DNA-binding transcriptional LysR family regulator